MSTNPSCIIPQKGVDDKIAEKVPQWNSYIVAVLRDLYKKVHNSDTTDPKVLTAFRQSLKEKELKEFNEAVLNPVAAYDQLKLAFPKTQTRLDRINLVVTLFEAVVDKLEQQYPYLDRDEIILGFTDEDGDRNFGPALIYEAVYNEIDRRADKAWKAYDDKIYNAYMDVLRNWGALVTYANAEIRDLEGITIGVNLTYANQSKNTGVDDSFVESFNMEEATKERWQESTDSINPYTALSPIVKRALSTLPLHESSDSMDVDDLGIPRRNSTPKMYQTIMNILQGMSGEADMMNKLKEHNDNISWMPLLMDKLTKDPLLRTQFYVNFGKCFQKYAMEDTAIKSGVHRFAFKVLNTLSRKRSISHYLSQVLNDNVRRVQDAIFIYRDPSKEDGGSTGKPYFNTDVAAKLSTYIKTILDSASTNNTNSTSIFTKKQTEVNETNKLFNVLIKRPLEARKEFYSTVFNALGLVVTNDELTLIASNYKKMRALNKAIQDLPMMLDTIKAGTTFEDAINTKYGKNATEGFLYEKLGKIINVVDSVSSTFAINRITFQDNAYFSNIQSSYLGRFIDRLESLSKKGDIRAVREFIEQKYLKNPFFCFGKNSEGKPIIPNRWLHDLYYDSPIQDDSLINNITYARLLGDRDSKFEDFGPKKQLLNQIFNFFAEAQEGTTNAKYRWYPVFILGDSGSSKWIKAKNYTGKEVINGLYEVFLQERVLQRQINEMKKLLTEQGKSLGSLAKIDTTKYCLLEFLNDTKNYPIDEGDIENSIKKAIKKYLENSTKELWGELVNIGAFEQENGKYKYLDRLTVFKNKDDNSKEYSPEEAIKNNLMNYVYNSTFATIMQMQLMTVSNIFYKNGSSIDLQKRFKEIHASGNILSIEALDFEGRRFSTSPYQRTVYFDDIKVNPEETNAEFMEVIKNLFGENSTVYKQYRDEASLTDGQGYRTLKSYRAIMGMAGKWTKKCEDAYNELDDIRKEIRDNGEITEDHIERIEELQLVLQPVKPFMYTLEEYPITIDGKEEIVQIPVQMKYAEALVIPELLPKDSKLRKMIEWAESTNVDVIAATTTTKVGDFGSVEVSEATNEDSLGEALSKAYIHELDYHDYVIQTNVPEHIQGSQLFATQSRKISFANLRQTDDNGNDIDYSNYIGGRKSLNLGDSTGEVKPTAYNMNRLYVATMAANILQDFDSYTEILKDPEKLRQALIQMTINNSRETRDNLKGYSKGLDSDFIMALFEGGIEQDTASLLLSLYKKKVNKQKILGGSAVQVSAFGITGYTENNSFKFYKDPNNNKNILYGTCEIPWDLSYTNSKGEKIQLDYNNYCNTDGTLKLSNEILDRDDPRYKDYLPYTDKNEEVHIPLIEKEYPGILSFIAYRIPTEEKYSMLNMKITRFSLKTNGGGTIKVPAQGTTIAGFDFKQYWSH